MAALTGEERQALLRQSHPVHGEPGEVRPLDVSRLLDECHRLMLPDQSARTASLEVLCLDVSIVRNLVCGGEAAFALVECLGVDGEDAAGGLPGDCHHHDARGEHDCRKNNNSASTSGRVAGLLADIVDTYFDADICSDAQKDGVSMLLEDANVALLAKARRVTCQVVVNACSSSARWRSSIAARLFPRRFTCLALTDDVRVVGSLAYALHTMVNIDDVDCVQRFRMEQLVQLIALMLQVEARYGANGANVQNGANDANGAGTSSAANAGASLEILLTHICLRRGMLREVVRGLCFRPSEAGTDLQTSVRLNSNHAYLLDALAVGAAHDKLPPPDRALTHLHELIELARRSRDEDAQSQGSRDEHVFQEHPVESVVIRGCLHLWRDAMARESTVVSTSTLSAALPTFLDMLRREEHIADVLSVIANACYQRPDVHDCLLGAGLRPATEQPETCETHENSAEGFPAAAHDTLCLILGHARGNPDAPLAREWALMAIRNLCACSQDARDAIQALEKVEGAAATPAGGAGGQTQNATFKVEYDASVGGWKLGVDVQYV